MGTLIDKKKPDKDEIIIFGTAIIYYGHDKCID
jgi:hypothetical protein